MKIYLANNAAALVALNPTHSIEAEFGDTVVNGSVLTLAHHGSRGDNPCPCIAKIPKEKLATNSSVIVISHFDLDTLGGVMACLGRNTQTAFWRVVAHIDVKGRHTLDDALANILDEAEGPPEYPENTANFIKNTLNAYWAWSWENRLVAPLNGSLLDVTQFVLDAIQTLVKCMSPSGWEEGKIWAAAQETLNWDTYHSHKGGVIVRISKEGKFCNHLYTTPNGDFCIGNVTFNEVTKAITMSLVGPVKRVNCEMLMQALFGPDAGGHDVIAGSPRGQQMTFDEALECQHDLISALKVSVNCN